MVVRPTSEIPTSTVTTTMTETDWTVFIAPVPMAMTTPRAAISTMASPLAKIVG